MTHLESHNLLSPFQSSFRSDHNAQTALLHLTHNIQNGIEHGFVTLLLLIDFRRAFNSVSHESLLMALQSLNLSAQSLRLIHCYSTGREKTVMSDHSNVSALLPVTSGVPQRSSFGPVLFSTYQFPSFCLRFLPHVLRRIC